MIFFIKRVLFFSATFLIISVYVNYSSQTFAKKKLRSIENRFEEYFKETDLVFGAISANLFKQSITINDIDLYLDNQKIIQLNKIIVQSNGEVFKSILVTSLNYYIPVGNYFINGKMDSFDLKNAEISPLAMAVKLIYDTFENQENRKENFTKAIKMISISNLELVNFVTNINNVDKDILIRANINGNVSTLIKGNIDKIELKNGSFIQAETTNIFNMNGQDKNVILDFDILKTLKGVNFSKFNIRLSDYLL